MNPDTDKIAYYLINYYSNKKRSANRLRSTERLINILP